MARSIASDHEQKRSDILRAAAKLFAGQGFDRASMNQVARACGISKANIYHYYDSKEALLYDILDTYLADLRDRVCGIDLEGLAPEARLGRVVSEILLAYQGMDHEHQVQITGMAALPPGRQEVLRDYQRDMVHAMSEVLSAIAPEVFEGDKAKLRAAAMSVFAMLNWFYMWNDKADEAARRDYARLVTGLTIGGLKAL